MENCFNSKSVSQKIEEDNSESQIDYDEDEFIDLGSDIQPFSMEFKLDKNIKFDQYSEQKQKLN